MMPNHELKTWEKIPFTLVLALAFYGAWHASLIQLVWAQGELRGPDDFLRLHQVLTLLSGQSWFDLTVYRMAPPLGADVHWSRLVDLPIAGLISFFNLFLEQESAWRLAAIIWPMLVFMATYWMLSKICAELVPGSNSLIVLFFYVLSFITIAETAPGRLDHHNIQILLLLIALLGLCLSPSVKSDALIGISIPISLSIGLDSAALFLPIVVFMGLCWVVSPKAYQFRMLRVGLIFVATSIAIYLATFAVENWNDHRCDAYSLFYVAALVKLGTAFVLIAVATVLLPILRVPLLARLFIGGGFGLIALVTLLFIFPQCASGPFGGFTNQLQELWLWRVVEAKGILEAVQYEPSRWFSDFAFAIIMLLVSLSMALKFGRSKPELFALLAIVGICTFGIFFQIRFLRTGIIVAIPFTILFALMSWQWLKSLPFTLKLARFAALGLICLPMTSFFWSSMGKLVYESPNSSIEVAQQVNEKQITQEVDNRLEALSCNAHDAYIDLNHLPAGLIMSDINSATPILVHTHHSVISGPYHRNAEAILDVMQFFETNALTARAIADKHNIDFVALCNASSADLNSANDKAMSSLIRADQVPEWLRWVSTKDSMILVLKRVQ